MARSCTRQRPIQILRVNHRPSPQSRLREFVTKRGDIAAWARLLHVQNSTIYRAATRKPCELGTEKWAQLAQHLSETTGREITVCYLRGCDCPPE